MPGGRGGCGLPALKNRAGKSRHQINFIAMLVFRHNHSKEERLAEAQKHLMKRRWYWLGTLLAVSALVPLSQDLLRAWQAGPSGSPALDQRLRSIIRVSNGTDTRTYATETGELLKDGLPTDQAFAALMDAAMKIALSDLQEAIKTLMEPGSDVWMAAIRSATEQTLDELTGICQRVASGGL